MIEGGKEQPSPNMIAIEASIQRLQDFLDDDPLGTRDILDARLQDVTAYVSTQLSLLGGKPLGIVGGSMIYHDFNPQKWSDIDIACVGENEIPNEEAEGIKGIFKRYQQTSGIRVDTWVYSMNGIKTHAAEGYSSPNKFINFTRAGVATVLVLTGKPLIATPENISTHARLQTQAKMIIKGNPLLQESILQGLQIGIQQRLQRRGTQ